MYNLTNEERARIFGMYIGNKCLIKIEQGSYSTVLQVTGDMINNYLSYKDGDRVDFVLLLTPLSKITDEHAIEVAKIWHPNYYWKVIKKSKGILLVECDDYIMWIDCVNASFYFEEKYIGFENIDAHRGEKETTYCENIVEIIDYLRELGYSLPYKGKCLFELGIAIDKDTLK